MHFIVNRARFDRLPMVGARLHISRCFANYTLVCATDQKSNVSSKAPAGTLRPFKLACKLDRVFGEPKLWIPSQQKIYRAEPDVLRNRHRVIESHRDRAATYLASFRCVLSACC